MYKKIGTCSRHISWLYLFLGGFLSGTLIINIWRSSFLGEMDLLNAVSLSRLKYLDIDGSAFFIYVLRKRLEVVMLLCLLATTYVGTAAVSLYAAGMGVMAGILLSISAIRYGLKGILLIAAGIMPQYLFLVPACIMLMNWCYQLCVGMYYPGRSCEVIYGDRKQYFMKKILQLFLILGVVIIGSLIESYVNPILFFGFLKIF